MTTAPLEVPDRTAAFRAQWRSQNVGPRYQGWLHFAFTTSGALAAVVFAASRLHDVRGWEWLVLPAGFLVANVAEYLGHRGPMHHPTAGLRLLHRRHSLEHHRYYTHERMAAESHVDFKMVLFPPVMLVFFLGALATPIGAAAYFLVSPNAGWLFGCVGVGYFLTYEWLHWSYHQPADSVIGRLGLVRVLRRHHTLHHDPAHMQRANFNITFPVADALFGTRESFHAGTAHELRDETDVMETPR